ncbi:MAG TPA: response regulator [Pyrinomonadaceae bacterium]|nr:response regulator [Pyrinomonadaceae bacterium]
MLSEGEKINILMVDDNAANLLALEAILQAPDRNLVSASSGDEALRYLLGTDVAVILLDVYMPGIDGLETAAMIRGREKSRDIPIIFLTADSTGHRHISRGYSLGAVDYILKPVEPDILRSKVAVFVELFKKTEEIKRQAELLHEKNVELEEANLQRLGRLIDLGQQLAAERDPERVLDKFCHAARDIVGAEHAAVGVVEGDGPEPLYSCRSDAGGTEADGGGQSPPAVEGVIAMLLEEGRTLRLGGEGEPLAGDQLPPTRPAARSLLGTPITHSGHALGWLYLADKIGADEFSEADERLAGTLATQVAVAYESARLYAEAQRQAAVLKLEVAERKQAEEARARMLVREQAARADAERANRTKDEFLATLSHELRTPLTAILGWARLLRTSRFEGEQLTRALETIERNARSQSQLIDDLLDVSRIITGKLRIDAQPIELVPIVEAAIDSIRPAAEAKSISFGVALDPAAGRVSGDADRMQQVVWNLFSNAVKFTPEGGRVEVSLERAGSHARISVADTGVGIDAKFLPFIFDRFRQADGSTTRKHGGLGLGLAIVRHLVELHGGEVSVRSDGAERGSTFQVVLPLLEGGANGNASTPAEDAPAAAEVEAAAAPAASPLEGLCVLVVDDEADTRDWIAAVLRRNGAAVRSCGSAAEALRLLDAWEPDMLVSDIGMPREDGYSLIKKVRRSGAGSRVPALALTAYASADDRARALDAGFQEHLVKPVEPERLVSAIASLVERRRAAT